MLLSSIVASLEHTLMQGDPQIEITGIAFDSREVKKGSLFVAITGFETDGHQYIDQAIERGAVAVIVEKKVEVRAGIPILMVQDAREALAKLSAVFYGNPTADMNLIGVTGTNGKTSITYLIQAILEQAGRSVGLIGTMGSQIKGDAVETRNTTPESLHLQQLFATMRESGVEDCVMEVSSHALHLKRTAYSRFNTGIFTNLTPDHLELHQSMENYFEAKAQLFEQTTEMNIINADDPYGLLLIKRLNDRNAPVLSYGIHPSCDIYATHIQCLENRSVFTAHTPAGEIAIQIHFPGMIYVYNALAAIAYGVSQGISLSTIQLGLHNLTGIRGRMETVYEDAANKVVVDFAHTEDGLEQVLTTIRSFASGRVILVFGVYGADGIHGERKRRAMGKVAGTYADISVVTSDNPKRQNPVRLIHEITRGVKQAGGSYHSFVDRKEAIHFALSQCLPGDIVLITGKGHETTQLLGSTLAPFNEKEIVNAFMTAKNLAGSAIIHSIHAAELDTLEIVRGK
ncbi:UDP-N-acetylmuramoyl-L-alanyl-D-glutamate--2,6-diaminopimelate ligase [Paenibacillus radicis (ex Gao et al. 2016)]|uniref:UDP-N-acetylmuramyl-tripeptide synthetase n=1 Tax=Paenibacillus radicis (ex Gao et al. 2016) TaxID=1737354 RepID=A0A917HT91_9BACL|nr:UDP-N-acetylmuramoyl-L-alanyl-D-glutamate--2,6-diaminopimelate ligase [Paenibacillus radicis (ex Gao et al. 2016)]GGG88456.1 UDP-N-acetylmuramoyl-L-alanyl-D-glutamate--2,6-diaminopimelate ligase [Paenibacillus radicis (ex Gao et al. 2016)]